MVKAFDNYSGSPFLLQLKSMEHNFRTYSLEMVSKINNKNGHGKGYQKIINYLQKYSKQILNDHHETALL